jgi:hypothetical protein
LQGLIGLSGIQSEDATASRCRFLKACHDPNHRRLTRSVFSQQGDDRAGWNPQVDSPQRFTTAVMHLQLVDLDDIIHRETPDPWWWKNRWVWKGTSKQLVSGWKNLRPSQSIMRLAAPPPDMQFKLDPELDERS